LFGVTHFRDNVKCVTSSWNAAVNELSFDSACDVVGDLHAARRVMLLQELDVVAHLSSSGEPSLHDFLCLHLGLTSREAKEYVVIANALVSLPLVREAFRNGELNWAKLVLVVQLAELPEDDERFAEEAPAMSVNQLKVLLRRKKAGDVSAAERAHRERSVSFHHDDEKQETRFNGALPLDLGIAIEKLLQARADSYSTDPITGEYPQPPQAMIDALCDILFGDAAPRADLLIDLEVGALAGDGKADLEGHTLNRETLQRLACDGSARASFIDEKGLPVALGRKSRLFPSWLSRQILHRDRGCRFPGCGSIRWLHDHHMAGWEDDHGNTDYDNGIKLCGTHHRHAHEGGWKLRGNPDQELQFIRPDGKVFKGRPPKPTDKLITRIEDMATALVERVIQERRDLEDLREIEREEQEAQWREAQERREREREELRERERQAHDARIAASPGWGDPAA
jgi:hypothetical protein